MFTGVPYTPVSAKRLPPCHLHCQLVLMVVWRWVNGVDQSEQISALPAREDKPTYGIDSPAKYRLQDNHEASAKYRCMKRVDGPIKLILVNVRRIAKFPLGGG